VPLAATAVNAESLLAQARGVDEDVAQLQEALMRVGAAVDEARGVADRLELEVRGVHLECTGGTPGVHMGNSGWYTKRTPGCTRGAPYAERKGPGRRPLALGPQHRWHSWCPKPILSVRIPACKYRLFSFLGLGCNGGRSWRAV